MTGCDPSAVDGRPEWFRNVGESDLQGSGQPGGGLVAELARRAVLLGRVLLVADGGGGRGAGQRQRQREDPSVPAWATSCRPRVHGLSLGHQAVDATRESPKAARTARAVVEAALVHMGPQPSRGDPGRTCSSSGAG